jgi:two-component system phosphate regulon sensor histidine kinase PhoR
MNKKKKVQLEGLLAGMTFLALIMLVVIQISWILKAAKLEEQNFSHRVSHVMITISEEIAKRASNCNTMKDYICGKDCPMASKHATINEIDSIVKTNLKLSNIELDYNFSIGDSLAAAKERGLFKSKCYLQNVVGLTDEEEIRLWLRFPGRNQFLLAQMKGWFIVSLLFILFIATSFFITLRMFFRERAMAHRTTDFINNMVHEFQTPIANIMLATNLIKKRKSENNDNRTNEYTDIILHESRKMEQNVEDILKVSSLEHQSVEKTEVDIHAEIRKQADHFKYRIDEKNGEIILNLNAEKHCVFGDKGHFALLLSNLIDNALKYNSEEPKIIISTRDEKSNLILEIEDNGIGISQKDIASIFDKYYRVPTGDLHNIKGFGLGLTCVKKIADIYKGSVKVESTIGKGTIFTIILPLSDECCKN